MRVYAEVAKEKRAKTKVYFSEEQSQNLLKCQQNLLDKHRQSPSFSRGYNFDTNSFLFNTPVFLFTQRRVQGKIPLYGLQK